MGNGLFNPPPGPIDGGSLPDIPVADFVSTGQAVAQGASQSTFVDDWLAKYWAGKPFSLTLAWGAFASLITEAVSLWVKVWTQLQATDNIGLYDLIAAVVEDIVGVDISGDAMRSAYLHQGRGAALTEAGAALFGSLEKSITTSSGPVTALSGYASARAFAGWLMELSIRQGNVALFSSMIPEEYRFMEGVVEYGEQLSKNFGFGRLARRAFTPLLDAIISKPLTWSMNQTYRPAILSESQAVRAFHHGAMTQPDAESVLAAHGYNDADIARLLIAEQKNLSERDILALVRAGVQDVGGVVALIASEGYSQENAGLVWEALQEEAQAPIRQHLISVLLHQLQSGLIDLLTFNTTIDGMNLLPVERSYWQQVGQQIVTSPRRHLSESEIERAFLEGLIDMSTAQSFWQSVGYSFDSIQVLTLLLIQKQQGHTKTTVGHKPIRHLTEAELEKAYKAGILTLAQLQAQWTLLGYSPGDIATLTALVQIPPSSGTPTPA